MHPLTAEGAVEALCGAHGCCCAGEDAGEVISGKRRRTPVDYAVLNSYLFGGEQDEDHEDAEYAADPIPDDSDDEFAGRTGSKRSKKRRRAAPT